MRILDPTALLYCTATRFEGSSDEIVATQSLCDVRTLTHHMCQKSLPHGEIIHSVSRDIEMAERIKSKATINFYKCENKEVKSPKSKNMAIRVYNFLQVCPNNL